MHEDDFTAFENDDVLQLLERKGLRNDCLTLTEIQFLQREGVRLSTILGPPMIGVARGFRSRNGFFYRDPAGERWLAVDEGFDRQTGLPFDTAYFRLAVPHVFAQETKRSFALNEEAIGNAATYSFGGGLTIHASVLDWLAAGKSGVVILDWTNRAFDRLRHCARIRLPSSLERTFRAAMRPLRLPDVELYDPTPRGRQP